MKNLTLLFSIILLASGICLAQSAAFTYQGKLSDGGSPANGNYDLQFALFDTLSGGAQIGATQTASTVAVSAGIFKVQLDFGASAFPGANRWLEISARPAGVGSFTPLSPRQQITSTPYAVRSLNAASADSVPVSALPAGNGNYIQNTGLFQASANFNISGNGTAGGTLSGNIVSATTQFNIGIDRILGLPGTGNLFAGLSAGRLNSSGSFNSFFGLNAGNSNTTGSSNSFFGAASGRDNTTKDFNSFFGTSAGVSNFGGSRNSFFGVSAGQSNIFGSSNTIVGEFGDVGLDNLNNATAIGARALVSQNNSLVLGSINGVNSATADTNVGIGTTAPARRLQVKGAGSDGAGQTDLRVTGTGAIASGITLESTGTDGRSYSLLSTAIDAGGGGAGGGRLAVFDVAAGAYRMVLDSSGNVGIGFFTPTHKLEVNGSVAGVGPYQDISDLRFKKDVQPLTGALSKVLRLRGVSFDWRRDEFPAMNFGPRRQVGFIAQEMAAVLPEAVNKDNRGYYRMAYAEVTPVLVEAIKEQQQMIESLKQETSKLKVSNARAEACLAALEATVKRMAHQNRRQRRRN